MPREVEKLKVFLHRPVEEERMIDLIQKTVAKISEVSKYNYRSDFSKNIAYVQRWKNLLVEVSEGRKTSLSDADMILLTDEKLFRQALSFKLELIKGQDLGMRDGDFCGYPDVQTLDKERHAFGTFLPMAATLFSMAHKCIKEKPASVSR